MPSPCPAADACVLRPLLEKWAAAGASEHGEEEVMCVVAPMDGSSIDPRELLEFLMPRMPHFLVPRFVRIVDALPKTPTQKAQKHILRAAGLTEDTWDREKAGIKIKRQKF